MQPDGFTKCPFKVNIDDAERERRKARHPESVKEGLLAKKRFCLRWQVMPWLVFLCCWQRLSAASDDCDCL